MLMLSKYHIKHKTKNPLFYCFIDHKTKKQTKEIVQRQPWENIEGLHL